MKSRVRAHSAELFSGVGRSTVVEPAVASFRLENGDKMAELCFEGSSRIIVLSIENSRFCAGK
jgi:hypothetical protein